LDIDDEKKIIYNYKHNIYFNHDIKVYLIDFGLVKKMVKNGEETQINEKEEKQNGFVGTYTYASLSAHKKEELGKKDDLWSFFFMLLDLMDENLPWRNINFENEDAIIDCKKKCLEEPKKYLFLKSTKNNKEIMTIFEYIKNLKFETEPDYNFIMNQLLILKNKEIQKILYNNEINNQILILQQNLLIKNNNTNNTQQLILNNNKSSQQDYIIYKLNKTNNRSIPSLNSTNYSSSIYYKTNYINCISGNNNENFYQSVLKPCSKSPNKITQTKKFTLYTPSIIKIANYPDNIINNRFLVLSLHNLLYIIDTKIWDILVVKELDIIEHFNVFNDNTLWTIESCEKTINLDNNKKRTISSLYDRQYKINIEMQELIKIGERKINGNYSLVSKIVQINNKKVVLFVEGKKLIVLN
jgi:serine/threonine protein kinase